MSIVSLALGMWGGEVRASEHSAGPPPESVERDLEDVVLLESTEKSGAIHKGIIRYTALIGVPLGVLAYGRQFWNWGSDSSWRWGFEGWFGADTDLGGMDKLGHAHAHYLITRLGHRVFDYTEDGRPRKHVYAALLAAVIGTGIEVGDAFTGRFGFSPEDLIADYVGIALGVLTECYPTLDGFLGFTAFYWPTRGFREHPDGNIMAIESDASGWRHALNLKLSGFEAVAPRFPWYLRILQLNVGYFTRGFSRFDGRGTHAPKVRNLFFGVTLDFQEISKEMIRPFSRVAHAITHEVFHYLYLPVGYQQDLPLD